MKQFLDDWREFWQSYQRFFSSRLRRLFFGVEKAKKKVSFLLYRQRGRFAQPFAHLWMGILVVAGIFLSPTIEENLRGRAMGWEEAITDQGVVGGSEYLTASTALAGSFRGEIAEYIVKEGDTISSIAQKFDVSIDTIMWANNLTSAQKIKSGQRLKIPPVSGVIHTVKRGDTVYSIAKYYASNPQSIVDFPFNSFSNDETFALQIGQQVIVPDGVMPKEQPVAKTAPAAIASVAVGATVAKGIFIWPTTGVLTQYFSWYHPGIDIANKDGPTVVAAAGGKVVNAIHGRYGYGNHVVIDHGNGYRTLYGHLNSIAVAEGQDVSQGQMIGQMGSTGRSTGTHLHFEIISDGGKVNPLSGL